MIVYPVHVRACGDGFYAVVDANDTVVAEMGQDLGLDAQDAHDVAFRLAALLNEDQEG